MRVAHREKGRNAWKITINFYCGYYHSIYPSARAQAALLINRGHHYLAELARVLETSWPSAARLEYPSHWPTLKQLDRAAKALSKKLVINLEDL